MPIPSTTTISRTIPVTPAKRPLLRLTRHSDEGSGNEYFWLRQGKQGSLQTAYQMARYVREDVVRDEGLQRFAAERLIENGLDSHSDKREIVATLCRYVQRVPYIHDPSGAFDSISSARQTLAKGFGDCDDLAVLLATLLALVGFEPRFVLAKYKAQSRGYDHVYVDVVLPNGRMPLDPCSRNNAPGWESLNSYERLTYPIFVFSTTSLGDAMNLAITGASIGANFIPGVGPIISALVGPISSLFSRKQQRAEETTRDEFKDQLLRAMEKIEAAVNSCQITKAEGAAAAKELTRQFYAACDQFTKKSVGQSCRNFETQDIPGGPQEGAIRTHQARIEAAGSSCGLNKKQVSNNVGDSTATASSLVNSSVSVGGAQFPIWLLIAGGVGLFFLMQK